MVKKDKGIKLPFYLKQFVKDTVWSVEIVIRVSYYKLL